MTDQRHVRHTSIDVPAHLDLEVKDLLEHRLREADVYFEWGSGGSTFMAVESRVPRIFSVESDPAWVRRLAASPAVVSAIESRRMRLSLGDVGPTGRWGYPIARVTLKQALAYSRDPWVEACESVSNPASSWCVLVDGRFRKACALTVALSGVGGDLVVDDMEARPHLSILRELIGDYEPLGRAGLWRLPVAMGRRPEALDALKRVVLDPR